MNTMNLKLYSLGVFLVTLLFVSSCQQQFDQIDPTEKEEIITTSVFQPSQSVKIEEGILVFDNQEDALITLQQISANPRESIDIWEKGKNFTSQQSLFYAVMQAADSIDDYYWSLPEEEQAYWKNQPEIHPQIYYLGLKEGWLKLEKNTDGSEYFQYGAVDPAMAPVINRDGFVKVEGKLYQFTSNSVKILLSGDVSQKALLSRATVSDNENIVVINLDDPTTRSLTTNFSDINSWIYASNKNRYRLWLNGSSSPSTTPLTSDCVYGMSCTFQIRSEAQKKNFWGNWNYKGTYGYSLSIGDARGDATWTYSYKLHNNNGNCGLSNTCISGPPVGSYSCSGSSSATCPTSPYSTFYSWTNNGYFALTPHGGWTSNDYFCEAFDIDYQIFATYNQQWTLQNP